MLILIAANGCAVSTGESPPQASQPGVEGLQLPAGNPFGVWKLNARRSVNPSTGSLIVRSEPHAKGEAFTLDRGGSEGRVFTSVTILYLDGNSRDVQDGECSGDAILAAPRQPDCGDSAPVRRWMDSVRPASVDRP